MEQKQTLSPDDRPNPGQITILHCASHLRLDPAPLSAIYAEKGADATEDTICRVLEDVAIKLNTLHQARRDCDFDGMVKPAARLAAVAGQIGLVEMSVAASNTSAAAAAGDSVALEATLARLERAFDTAVSQIWDAPQICG